MTNLFSTRRNRLGFSIPTSPANHRRPVACFVKSSSRSSIWPSRRASRLFVRTLRLLRACPRPQRPPTVPRHRTPAQQTSDCTTPPGVLRSRPQPPSPASAQPSRRPPAPTPDLARRPSQTWGRRLKACRCHEKEGKQQCSTDAAQLSRAPVLPPAPEP